MKRLIGSSAMQWPARLALGGLVSVTLAASCDDKREEPATITRLTADGHVIMDSTPPHPALKYSLDGEKYGKWVVAQRALDSIPNLTVPTRVSLGNFTEDDVDAAADWLDDHEQARAAFRRADISAKDYVRTSVALEQLVATMSASPPVRLIGVPPENVAFISRQAGFRETFDARRVRVVGSAGDDADSDSDSESDSGARAAGARDVDSDSDGRNGKAKAKGRGKAKGKNGNGNGR